MKTLLYLLTLVIVGLTSTAQARTRVYDDNLTISPREGKLYTTAGAGCPGPECDFNAISNVWWYADNYLNPIFPGEFPSTPWATAARATYGSHLGCWDYLQPVVTCHVEVTDPKTWEVSWEGYEHDVWLIREGMWLQQLEAKLGLSPEEYNALLELPDPPMLRTDSLVALRERASVVHQYLLQCSGLRSCRWEGKDPRQCCEVVYEAPGRDLVCSNPPIWPLGTA